MIYMMNGFGRRKCFGHHRQSAGTTGKVTEAHREGPHPRKATWAKCGREPAPRWAGAPLTLSPGAPEREGGETLGAGGPKAHLGVRHPLSLPWPLHLPSGG